MNKNTPATAYTECCPNCDLELPSRVWDGQAWYCQECEEYGTFHAAANTMTSALRHPRMDILLRYAALTEAELVKEVGVEKYFLIKEEIYDYFNGNQQG